MTHKARPIKEWLTQFGIGELFWQSPDLKPLQHLWYELQHPTSVPKLNCALVAEWEQIPAARFQNLVESLPRRVDAVTAAY